MQRKRTRAHLGPCDVDATGNWLHPIEFVHIFAHVQCFTSIRAYPGGDCGAVETDGGGGAVGMGEGYNRKAARAGGDFYKVGDVEVVLAQGDVLLRGYCCCTGGGGRRGSAVMSESVWQGEKSKV